MGHGVMLFMGLKEHPSVLAAPLMVFLKKHPPPPEARKSADQLKLKICLQ